MLKFVPFAISVCLLANGCAQLERLRGDGIAQGENWSNGLRNAEGGAKVSGGLTNKARQIESNLGVP